MTHHTPTDEQAAIIAAAVGTEANLLVNALAGAAKTSTLVMIAQALRADLPILSLAFNKRIADEMRERLPGNVKCATLNGVGHTIWGNTIGKRLVLNTKKNFECLNDALASHRVSRADRADFDFAETLGLIRAAKSAGYLPEGAPGTAQGLVTKEQFYASLDEEPSRLQQSLLETVLVESIKLAYQGKIDFDDQIYMSTLYGGAFPQFPLVLVDEAQDLSRLNRRMLGRLVRKRVIAVGDPWQSIYAFRGADTRSMQSLREEFSMDSFTLSITFRCPKSVVSRARNRVPHFRWSDWAAEGEVREYRDWSCADIPDGAAIICRNNAPLFKLALTLLRSGRGCQLVGADIGPGLVKILRKLGPESMKQTEVLDAIDQWEEAKLAKSRSPGAVADRAECLRVFAGHGDDLGGAISYAEHLFSSKGPIQLLSGHKAKGLEWNTVFHLDPWRIPSKFAEGEEALEQELNVRYVIETRPKAFLGLINLNQMAELAPKEAA